MQGESKQGPAASPPPNPDLPELELSAIYDTAPVGLCVYDTDLRYVRINQRLAEINGFPPSAHIGRTIGQVIPDLARHVGGLLRQVIQSGEPMHNVQLAGETPAQPGVRRTWVENYTPLKDKNGRVVAVNVMVEETTERTRLEAELEARERTLHEMADALPALIAIVDRDARYEFVNKAYERLLGQPVEEIVGRQARDVLGESLYRQIAPLIEAVLLGTEVDHELTATMYTGEQVDLRLHYVPRRDREGQVTGFYALVNDVTAVRRAERALRVSHQRFRQLADAMPQLVWTAEPDGTVDYYNRRHREYAGISPTDGEGWEWQPTVHPDDMERTGAAWQRALHTGERYEVEHRVRDANGSYRWVLSRAEPVRNAAGDVVKWYGTATDIHRQKAAEQALRESAETLEQQVARRTQALQQANEDLRVARDLFEALFHALPIPTTITRAEDGLILNVNEAYLQYFGWTREQVLGHTTTALALWPAPGDREAWLEEVGARASLRTQETPLRHPLTGLRTLLSSVESVTLDGVPCLISAFVDITERVEAENQVRQLASQLTLAEQRERQRIARILHDDLQQMLVAMQMNLSLATQDATGPLREALRELTTLANDTLRLTRDLTAELNPPVLRSERLSEAFIWLAAYMKDRYRLTVSITTDVQIEKDRLSYGQRSLLFRAVRELLFNVVKHAGVQEAALHLEQSATAVTVSVSDAGPGFDGTIATGGPAQGSGYGLYNVRERLQLFGGRLTVETVPGGGTTATVCLPVKQETKL